MWRQEELKKSLEEEEEQREEDQGSISSTAKLILGQKLKLYGSSFKCKLRAIRTISLSTLCVCVCLCVCACRSWRLQRHWGWLWAHFDRHRHRVSILFLLSSYTLSFLLLFISSSSPFPLVVQLSFPSLRPASCFYFIVLCRPHVVVVVFDWTDLDKFKGTQQQISWYCWLSIILDKFGVSCLSFYLWRSVRMIDRDRRKRRSQGLVSLPIRGRHR